MPIVLTTPQQDSLDQFEADAQTASDTAATNDKAQTDLSAAQLAADNASTAALAAHAKALESAQAFISLLVPPAPTPPVGATIK